MPVASVGHKKLIKRIRRLYPQYEVVGYPDPEVVLGSLVGLAEAALRADVFIWFSDTQAVVVEYQSEIHALKESNEWFNKEDIAGRDDLKKQICAKFGLGYVEVWYHEDVSDELLMRKIEAAAENSWITIPDIPPKEYWNTFAPPTTGFVQEDREWPTQKFVSRKLDCKSGKIVNKSFL
jgi:hypothetical protein